jgi:hypothetical protein
MKPNGIFSQQKRNNCLIDNRDGWQYKQFISGAISRIGGGRKKDFFSILKDQVVCSRINIMVPGFSIKSCSLVFANAASA